jgi:hypothetical protein
MKFLREVVGREDGGVDIRRWMDCYTSLSGYGVEVKRLLPVRSDYIGLGFILPAA